MEKMKNTLRQPVPNEQLPQKLSLYCSIVEKMKNNLQVLYLDFNNISDLKILQEISRFFNLVD
jgi:hypothetical protein